MFVPLALKYILESLGYIVLQASNGQKALDFLEHRSSDIDLVILDMNMPVLNGYETFLQMKQKNFTTPVIISTGYITETILNNMMENGVAGIIRKPFQKLELSQIIAQVLEKQNRN